MVVSGVILIGIHWMLALFRTPGFVLITLAADAFIVYYLVLNAIAKNKIIKGIKAVAGGDLEYQISLEHLRGEQREVAEMLNDIGTGLQKAVEKSVKSERLKTDLITNVSHDIKTPLTSIINYVDILKRSNIEDPKIQGYLEILEAKAQRLKTLTEDVVEASKVSSGNINLQLMDVNLVEMMNQTTGEFAEKFEHKNLELIQTLPNEPAIIHVDGRRMWRVLENLYNNAAKYAMPGTRVYADLSVSESEVKFSLKNVSEQQLNISADELTERFIRGDVSRSTEGSGLGLSIAKNLTELQGGTFELYLDGDLFKVLITFPRVRRLTKEKEIKKGKDRKSATGRRHRSDRRTSEEHEDRRYAGGAVADHESDIGIRYKIRKSLDLGRGYFDILSLRFDGIRITIIQEKSRKEMKMDELAVYLKEVFCIELLSAILSNPRDREKAWKVRIRPVLKKEELVFQFEVFIGKQVFHENLSVEEAVQRACEWLEQFRQMQY